MPITIGDRVGIVLAEFDEVPPYELVDMMNERRNRSIRAQACMLRDCANRQDDVLVFRAMQYLRGDLPWRVTLEQHVEACAAKQRATVKEVSVGLDIADRTVYVNERKRRRLALHLVAAGWEPVFGYANDTRVSGIVDGLKLVEAEAHINITQIRGVAFYRRSRQCDQSWPLLAPLVSPVDRTEGRTPDLAAYFPKEFLRFVGVHFGELTNSRPLRRGKDACASGLIELLDDIADNIEAICYALTTRPDAMSTHDVIAKMTNRDPFDTGTIRINVGDIGAWLRDPMQHTGARSNDLIWMMNDGFENGAGPKNVAHAADADTLFELAEEISDASAQLSDCYLYRTTHSATYVERAIRCLYAGFLFDARIRFHPCFWAFLLRAPVDELDIVRDAVADYMRHAPARFWQLNRHEHRRITKRATIDNFIDYLAGQASFALEGKL